MIQKFMFLILFLNLACGPDHPETAMDNDQVITVSDNYTSSTAGNLISSAMLRTLNLDAVFYPKGLIKPQKSALIDRRNREKNIESILEVYPKGSMDQFFVGNMKGKNIKRFLFQRITEAYTAELEVAGLQYHFSFKGGFPVSKAITQEGKDIDDERVYRVAISKYFFFSGETFPSYKFRNGIERSFQFSMEEVSARDQLKKYLRSDFLIPRLNEPRATVRLFKGEFRGEKKINQIQGKAHLSPFMGDTVITRGIVTAKGNVDWYPGGTQVYIQSTKQDEDDDPRTSEGINIYFKESLNDIKVGDYLEIKGEVYEQISNLNLTRTQLRNVSEYKVLNNKKCSQACKKACHCLSDPVFLNSEREIPTKRVSTYFGNLNNKRELKLSDGIDFWESLEGMQVKFRDLKIVGFRGGKESSDPFEIRDHLTLYVSPGIDKPTTRRSSRGGLIPTPMQELWNPQIISLNSGPISPHLNPELGYNVGEVIKGDIVGIVQYEKNIFGDGEYTFVIPEEMEAINKFNKAKLENTSECTDEFGLVYLDCRPKVIKKFKGLSMAVYNLKNLSGVEDFRINQTGKMITENLNCPDILGLVEVQDDNGLDFLGGSSADKTLSKIIEATECENSDYGTANIDPLVHSEGGVPGGNIRVSIIFNKNKLTFNQRINTDPREQSLILENGDLEFNPGRVFARDEAFRGTRKSLVAQFGYKGKDIFVIVNHFNSKLGDTPQFSAIQPVIRRSELRRSKLARKVNEFVGYIQRRNPDAYVAVMGDFNAYLNEGPMRILEGNILENLMFTLPSNRRYTTNHNGNSQSIDYIFVNKRLRSKLIFFDSLHINSDYMGRLSDHDPVYSIFDL